VTTFVKDDLCDFNAHRHRHAAAFSVLRHGNNSTGFCCTHSRGGAGFLELGGPILEWGLRDESPPAGFRGRAPGGGLGTNPQQLKKHYKLLTLEKYFVRHAWCQNDDG